MLSSSLSWQWPFPPLRYVFALALAVIAVPLTIMNVNVVFIRGQPLNRVWRLFEQVQYVLVTWAAGMD